MSYIENLARLFFGANESAQLLQKTVLVSNAATKALPSTPVTLLPAPGAGLLLVPTLTLLFFKSGSSAYTNIDPDGYLYTQYNTTADQPSAYMANDSRLAATVTGASDFLGVTTGVMWPMTYPFQDDRGAPQGWGLLPYPLAANANANKALELTMSNGSAGDLTGGGSTNPLTVLTTYLIVSVP